MTASDSDMSDFEWGKPGPIVPEGAVARVESTDSHREFVKAAEPDWVSIKIKPHAQNLISNDETAASWFGDEVDVITTSTIDDDDLMNLTIAEEAELVEAFQPDVHVAGDVSAYEGMSPGVRAELIQESMKNAMWLDGECDTDATIVPILKGPTVQERELCYRALEYFDHDFAAIYATRYFTANQGRNIYRLAKDLRDVHRESDLDLFVIGAMSPNVVEKAPPSVKAVAGQNQWRESVRLSDLDHQRASSVWEAVEASVELSLEYVPTEEDYRRDWKR